VFDIEAMNSIEMSTDMAQYIQNTKHNQLFNSINEISEEVEEVFQDANCSIVNKTNTELVV
jgi:hypothetical protein